MVQFITISLLSLLTTAFAQSGTISGTGSLPPYPTYSAPYPISNGTVSSGPTGTAPPPPPPTTSECPPPLTVTVTSSVTVTTTSDTNPFPTGTGTGGTVAPTGTASAGYGYPYYRRGMEMRGLNYREEKKERRSSWFSWL